MNIRNLAYSVECIAHSKKCLSAMEGFTLLEMLVTIVILTVGMVAVIQMFSIGMFADTDVENTTIAISLTQEKMEEIKNAASYAAIDGYVVARANIGGDFADFDRAVTVSGDPKEVTVTTYWTQKGEDNSVSLVTLFTDYDY